MNFANSSARSSYRDAPQGELYLFHDQGNLAVKDFVYTHIWGGPNEDSGGMAMRRPMSADDLRFGSTPFR